MIYRGQSVWSRKEFQLDTEWRIAKAKCRSEGMIVIKHTIDKASTTENHSLGECRWHPPNRNGAADNLRWCYCHAESTKATLSEKAVLALNLASDVGDATLLSF